ncbi:YhfC family intramembrane metalloprotease [Burkholderia guangdongensis]|uniref:YhfC family intramembrane metalloprotease n=1 Tax=Burkholderia guangdongensis TaxID=1792500 RepID=UPI0015CAC78E|nr:YhfC family intramembrane metalloprotease [Burkholderia guangdongensis]
MIVAPVTLVVLIAATLIIALLPIVLFRFLRKPLALDRRDAIVGIAVFTLFAMILERALHGVVLSSAPAGGWLTYPAAFVAYGALAAGVFEEVGRYLGLRFLTRRYGASSGDGRAIGYGLGHGGVEAWFVGVLVWGQWAYLAWLANRGELDTQLASLPDQALLRIHVMLSTLSVPSIAMLVLERAAALVLQVALSVLMWRGVRAGSRAVLPLAIVLHALADVPAMLYQIRAVPAAWIEAVYFVLAALLVGVLVKLCRPPRAAA